MNESDWSPSDDELDSQEAPRQPRVPVDPIVSMNFGKRLVAAIIDLFAAYVIGIIVAVIPWVNEILTVPLVVVLFMLMRDDFYAGRGIGKNLMGLQVVDADSGNPCTMFQSLKRNIVIFGPPLILYIIINVIVIFHLVSTGSAEAISWTIKIINTLGFIYIVIVIPSETYRAYNRADGRRFGDHFAGTKTVDAPMDFSNPFAKTRR